MAWRFTVTSTTKSPPQFIVRLLILALVFLAISLVLPWLNQMIGHASLVLTVLLPVAGGLLWGVYGGVALACIIVPFTWFVFEVLTSHPYSFPSTIPGAIAGLVVGYGTGRLRDLSVKLKKTSQQAHEALAQSERAEETLRQMALLAELNPAPMLRFDSTGKLLSFNPAARALLGGATETNASLSVIFPTLSGVDLRRCIREGLIERHDTEITNRHLHLLLRGVPEHDLVHVYATDITERMRTESERQSLAEQLQQAQKMEAIGTLAGGVAHDINNILSAIMVTASVMENSLTPGDLNAEGASDILTACNRGRDLTRNLLGFARKGKYVKTRFALDEVIDECKALLERTVHKKINILGEIGQRPLLIEGDRSQISQSLMNLCINAVDAMREAGTLVIDAREITIDDSTGETVTGLKSGNYVKLQVIDTGVGMDLETKRHAFEPFYTTKARGKGTGLGLAMVYGAITNHGGHVRIDSTPEQGTTVTVLLPMMDLSLDDINRPGKKKRSSRPGTGKILLVDDEELVRRSAKRALEELGYSVLLAEHGRAAVLVYEARQDDISLVILDLIMPEMDGYETFEKLRRVNGSVKVLVSSGYDKDERVESLLEAGAVGFLHKPLDVTEISLRIDAILSYSDQ